MKQSRNITAIQNSIASFMNIHLAAWGFSMKQFEVCSHPTEQSKKLILGALKIRLLDLRCFNC